MRKQPLVIVLVAVAAAAGAVLTLIVGFLNVWNCSSGDGGEPFVAGGSPQADVCSATGDGLLLILFSLAAVGGLAVGAFFVGRAWVRRTRAGAGPGLGFIGLLILTALLPLGVSWLANLPSNECTGEAEAAYEAWLDAGGFGELPFDCASY